MTVYDSFLSGEYLGWNSRNLTLVNCTIESRHLGLKTAGEIADLQQKIQILTAAAQKNIDWPRLLALFDRTASKRNSIRNPRSAAAARNFGNSGYFL